MNKKKLLSILFCFTLVTPVMAQFPIENNYEWTMCFMINSYGMNLLNGWRSFLLFRTSEKWRIGGGLLYETTTIKEPDNESIPYLDLKARRTDIGLSTNFQYLINGNNGIYHTANMQLAVKKVELGFYGEDQRARHMIESENSSTTSYEYELLPEECATWGGGVIPTIQLSYAIELNYIHMEFGLGFDLIDPFNRKYFNNVTLLTSSWNDFDKYYSSIKMNPYKELECGRSLSLIRGFHIGLCIGVNVTKLFESRQ